MKKRHAKFQNDHCMFLINSDERSVQAKAQCIQDIYSKTSMGKHIWDNRNLFEKWVVRATEG